MGFLKGYLYEIKSGIKIPFIVAIATGSGPKTFKTKLYAALAELWAGFESKRGPAECDKARLNYNPVFGENFATDILSQPLFVELLCFVCRKILSHQISNVLGLWGFLEVWKRHRIVRIILDLFLKLCLKRGATDPIG